MHYQFIQVCQKKDINIKHCLHQCILQQHQLQQELYKNMDNIEDEMEDFSSDTYRSTNLPSFHSPHGTLINNSSSDLSLDDNNGETYHRLWLTDEDLLQTQQVQQHHNEPLSDTLGNSELQQLQNMSGESVYILTIDCNLFDWEMKSSDFANLQKKGVHTQQQTGLAC